MHTKYCTSNKTSMLHTYNTTITCVYKKKLILKIIITIKNHLDYFKFFLLRKRLDFFEDLYVSEDIIT